MEYTINKIRKLSTKSIKYLEKLDSVILYKGFNYGTQASEMTFLATTEILATGWLDAE